MNWFWFAIIALLCWSGSDLFSKIGCCGERDKTAHLKMVVAVGVVMGLHAAYMVFFQDVAISWYVIWKYLPVSLLYILSMTLGYVGLRYIELSISSPICNSSGALVAVCCLLTPLLNTLLYMSTLYLLFGQTWLGIAQGAGYGGDGGISLLGFMLASVAVNGVAEAVACLILGTAVCAALQKTVNRKAA